MVVRVIDLSQGSSHRLHPLDGRLRQYLMDQLEAAIADDRVTSMVLTAPDQFSAGADLSEFASLLHGNNTNNNTNSAVPSLRDVVDRLDASPKPIVAAITGACLGGGLEVALACHYRICTAHSQHGGSKTKLGLPEVHVGVLPGAGGTQRLPRLVGLPAALTMILTGGAVTAKKAKALGLVDGIVDGSHDTNTAASSSSFEELVRAATRWAVWAEDMVPLLPRARDRTVPESIPVAHTQCHVASLSFPRHGSTGVTAALDAVRASFTMSFDDGLRREGELFLDLLGSSEGQARRHAFFAVRRAQKKVAVTIATTPLSAHPVLQPDVSSVPTAVIGAGTMGAGIALVLLQTGFCVRLVDVSPPALEQGVTRIHAMVAAFVKRRKVTPAAAKALLSRLSHTSKIDASLQDCQLVVEAVVEKLHIKQSIFQTLSQIIASPTCLLLSNTSTLSIDAMASVLPVDRQAYFAGWHFFSPAHVMKLVEIVVGHGNGTTSSHTTAILQALTKRIGKIGVVVGNCDGFCGNRLLRPYSAETVMLLVEGNARATVAEQDEALTDFGMALGPFQLSDLAGNDVGYNIRKERQWVREDAATAIPPPRRPARYTELADDMVTQLGRLGQKASKGWYDYDPKIGKGRKGLVSKEMDAFIQRYCTSTLTRNLRPEEIIERVLFPLVNEGFKCLEETIVRTPSDIDVVYIYGYGWPAWRGGPMYWADHDVGLPRLLRTLQGLSERFPNTEHYVPSKLLEACVANNMTVQAYCDEAERVHGRSRL